MFLFFFFTFQRLTDLELTVKLLLRMRANNDGGGRRRGGQWFGWFASCRSRQLRLNGNNGLTRTNLESQTRQIATALCLTGSLISLLVKYSHRFFSKSKQKKQQFKKELKCWVWIWNQTKRRVSFSPHVLSHIQQIQSPAFSLFVCAPFLLLSSPPYILSLYPNSLSNWYSAHLVTKVFLLPFCTKGLTLMKGERLITYGEQKLGLHLQGGA